MSTAPAALHHEPLKPTMSSTLCIQHEESPEETTR